MHHGEAVAVGLVFAAELAGAMGRIDAERVAEHRCLIDHYDLPRVLPTGVGDNELLAAMGRDKKVLDGLTFVLDGPDGVEPVHGVDPSLVRDTLDRVR
jgi:5-deoxy-5-amino-3-dehydroquinate synthase